MLIIIGINTQGWTIVLYYLESTLYHRTAMEGLCCLHVFDLRWFRSCTWFYAVELNDLMETSTAYWVTHTLPPILHASILDRFPSMANRSWIGLMDWRMLIWNRGDFILSACVVFRFRKVMRIIVYRVKCKVRSPIVSIILFRHVLMCKYIRIKNDWVLFVREQWKRAGKLISVHESMSECFSMVTNRMKEITIRAD